MVAILKDGVVDHKCLELHNGQVSFTALDDIILLNHTTAVVQLCQHTDASSGGSCSQEPSGELGEQQTLDGPRS